MRTDANDALAGAAASLGLPALVLSPRDASTSHRAMPSGPATSSRRPSASCSASRSSGGAPP